MAISCACYAAAPPSAMEMLKVGARVAGVMPKHPRYAESLARVPEDGGARVSVQCDPTPSVGFPEIPQTVTVGFWPLGLTEKSGLEVFRL